MTAHAAPGDPVRTTCPYCGTGCGVLGGPAVATPGDTDHPTNFGRVCAKGSALGETLGLENRLLHPAVDGVRTDMARALDRVASRFAETIVEHGPDSVAFYVSGQLLTEDYYVANKLMKGFIGSGNIDTNSRLCMSSSVAGHKRAFGEDLVPCCYEDLDEADLIVLVGSNAAWCHPILFRRMVDARARRGTRIICVDPRRTASAADADLFLGLKPGTDVALFNGLLAFLARDGKVDEGFVAASTAGFSEALDAAWKDGDVASVAAICDVALDDIEAFYRAFADTERVVTVYSQGVNQSSRGTDKVNAIINCHLATGRIGRAGMGPFSFTGQPNAMGGREVGGLANQLAAHMAFENPDDRDRVRRFWNAPRLATGKGLNAVEMFEAVGAGRIKALWVMGTNPAASMPDANRVRAALRACPFLVVSDCVPDTDTLRHAHVALPAAAWGEKDGTVTNSERRISRQRAFMPLPGEAKPDWWMISEVARRLGHAEAFAYRGPADIFREHAALSAFENTGGRVFDIGGLADIADAGYEALRPVQWPVVSGARHGTPRLLGDGRFPTADGRARLVPVRQQAPANPVSHDQPVMLNTGRVRDQWHTMTRTGEVPRLMSATAEPVLDVSPADAAMFGVTEGGLAEVRSLWGRALGRVRITDQQRTGEVFLPMHWTDAFASRASAGRVCNPACDPVSGQPELKHTPAAIAPFPMRWEGLFLSRHRRRLKALGYWARSAVAGGYLYRLGGTEPLDEGRALAQELLGGGEDSLRLEDRQRGVFRSARLDSGGRLSEVLIMGPSGAVPDARWLVALFAGSEPLTEPDRRSLLAARPALPQAPEGRIVCSCFGVGEARIARTLREEGVTDERALGLLLACGTNCGSCLPELRALVAQHGGREPSTSALLAEEAL
ncbi:molybdopterin-dependent oxidoreductase [Terrihabitans rhizophilus]|uniref:Molybdopterin-dependent oxidoreductase n=1 Tax=Terrihabitans rhizophilus TaxID=3092662 RepID=A0ABU4RP46_9HYPH|nr:molybdopterin-dependent oxidoreductase [Terrihabitans sp. PJ23]MDX6805869.1 molybdopterin-dependent oxidoreductase [Terrihabitans sp. PJ23]